MSRALRRENRRLGDHLVPHRRLVIGGKPMWVPMWVTRGGHGWRITFPGAHSRGELDSTYGSARASLGAARAWIESLIDSKGYPVQTGHYRGPNLNPNKLTGQPGISLVGVMAARGREEFLHFRATLPTMNAGAGRETLYGKGTRTVGYGLGARWKIQANPALMDAPLRSAVAVRAWAYDLYKAGDYDTLNAITSKTPVPRRYLTEVKDITAKGVKLPPRSKSKRKRKRKRK